MSAEYEPVIGLEIHVELLTETKLFCGCSTAFGAEPNTQVCSICLGLPGHRPFLNRKAAEYAIRAALALNCRVASHTTFDRKNYFYCDLPKGYQISQFFYPMGTHGHVDIKMGGKDRRIGLRQIHLEEDTGKLLHSGSIVDAGFSRVDFNRAGVPLIEIVSEPDIRSPEEARLFLQKLRAILLYTGISDCKMEEGSMRCDANVSLRPAGSQEFFTKTELKNMNSFRSVQKGIEYEIARQGKVLKKGGRVLPETRHFDETSGTTKAMRSKFAAADYRCFPDPNVPPLEVEETWVTDIKEALPEMPAARLQRFTELGLPDYDAEVLTSNKELADFFDAALTHYNNPKTLSNWLMGEFLGLLNAANLEVSQSRVTPGSLARLLTLMDQGTISGKIAKEVFADMFATGKEPKSLIEEKGLTQISDTGELERLAGEVLANNPGSVSDYKNGKKKALGFLVGQIMKATRGKANPRLANEILLKKLEEL